MEFTMLTKTKLALAAVLFAGSATIAAAQEADPNLLNRYPQYNGVVAAAPKTTNFQSSAVSLRNGRHAVQNQAIESRQPEIGNRDATNFAYDSAPLISGGGY
jgi:hypothetical protein